MTVSGQPNAGGLRRFARPRPVAGVAAPEERCELCGERLGTEHYSTVPDRVRHDPRSPLTEAEWAELQIPVSIAFFFFNSALGRVIASYPSPAGVTECELDLAAWDRLAAAHPLLSALAPDVEAILVTGGGPRETAPIETFLVPIDVCYSLAGALRLEWHGFDGGSEVKRILADLLASLRQRARVLEAETSPSEA
jgi:hypothetical protein